MHADLDVGGVAIVSHVVERFVAVPWRMGTSDYLAAIAGPTTPVGQPIGATPWDPELADAMNRHRVGVHEEAIFDVLLADLEMDDR